MAAAAPPSRRDALRTGAAAMGALWSLANGGCARAVPVETKLTIATGGTGGVYYTLGSALAGAWRRDLGLRTPPSVLSTAGSVENLALLAAGRADVVFAAADVADGDAPGSPVRALARVYDDAVQLVVPAGSPITSVAQLRGRRVSVGATDSGARVIADRVLEAAGLTEADLVGARLGIDESAAALHEGRIDAFFWSGGLLTGAVAALAATHPIRLVDLGSTVPELRRRYPVYDVGTVPAATYGIPIPVTTMLVRNFLLVSAMMPDELAGTLVAVLFEERELLVRANDAARAIDPRSAIGTQPIPLHPGAQRYFRETKDG